LITVSCTKGKKTKPISQGTAGEIYIMMDKRLIQHPLKNIIEQVFSMEKPYQCRVIPFENWEKQKLKRNLLIVGNVNDGSEVGNLILSHLSETVRENAKNNLGFVKIENDSFAVPQKIIYAYSGSDSLLAERFLQKGHNLADEFRLFEQKQTYNTLYKNGFEEKISEDIFKKHDFYLKLPKNTKLTLSETQKLTFANPDFSCTVVYADSAQTLPKTVPIQEKNQHIFEFKNMKILSLYNENITQFAFIDETQKRKYVFEFNVKGTEKVFAVQTLFSTFENAPEHNAKLKMEKN
jgi:hypothetical protein